MKTSIFHYKSVTEVGEILHKARSGRLILKLYEKTVINAGDTILNIQGKKIGDVNELIGSVNAPYASVILSDDDYVDRPGEKVFKLFSKKPRKQFSKRSKFPIGQKRRSKI